MVERTITKQMQYRKEDMIHQKGMHLNHNVKMCMTGHQFNIFI